METVTKRRLVVVSFLVMIVAVITTTERSSSVLGCTFSVTNKAVITVILAVTCCFVILSMPKELLNLKGRPLLITGCDTGFGHSLAKVLASRGCIVYAGCLFPDGEGANKLKSECANLKLYIVPLDVTSDDSVKQAKDIIERNLPDRQYLVAVVNNAGIWRWGEIEWCDVNVFKQVMDVNVYGMVRVTKAFLPHIRAMKGHIVNVSSMLGTFSVPAGAAYSMSKFAIESFSDSLRHEMNQWGVKVSVVQPGWYARATGIFGGHNDGDLRKLTEEVWNNMDDDCKQQYGREYFDAQIDMLLDNRHKTSADASPVVDAMLDAVMAKHPKHRYLVGEFMNTIMPCCILRFLPSWITDYGFAYAMSTYYPTPTALMKKKRK
ncbi:D-beta-hydroxybutyrate dehydrogenase, mitochondrial-like [Glandiceps talaboti]